MTCAFSSCQKCTYIFHPLHQKCTCIFPPPSVLSSPFLFRLGLVFVLHCSFSCGFSPLNGNFSTNQPNLQRKFHNFLLRFVTKRNYVMTNVYCNIILFSKKGGRLDYGNGLHIARTYQLANVKTHTHRTRMNANRIHHTLHTLIFTEHKTQFLTGKKKL